ncbi:O-antigen ligase [Shouchella clausii]|nr:O-antigen ligase [Shouchella clausii]MED4157534.1 O-antigen ligase [Shouchella clausii]
MNISKPTDHSEEGDKSLSYYNKFQFCFAVVSVLLFSESLLRFIFINNNSLLGPSFQIVLPFVYLLSFIFLIKDRKISHFKKIDKWLIVLLITSVISVLWSVNPIVTVQRVATILGTTIFGLFLGFTFSLKQIIKILSVSFVFIIMMTFIAVLFYPHQGLFLDHRGVTWQGVFPHKNWLGRYMVLGAGVYMFIILLSERKLTKLISFLLICISLGILFMTGSTTSYIILLAIFVLLPLFSGFKLKGNLFLSMSSFVLAATTLLAILILDRLNSILELFGRDLTFTGRTDIWSATLHMVSIRPFGYGYGAFWNNWDGPSAMVYQMIGRDTAPHAHNGFIDLMLNVGILGLLVFIIGYVHALLNSIKYIRQEKDPVSFWIMFYLVYFIFINIAESNIMVHNNLFWVLYVTVIAYLSVKKKFKPTFGSGIHEKNCIRN